MNEKQMKELARSEGFDNAEFLGTNQLQFDPTLRRYCEENACGNYGNNYACPLTFPLFLSVFHYPAETY